MAVLTAVGADATSDEDLAVNACDALSEELDATEVESVAADAGVAATATPRSMQIVAALEIKDFANLLVITAPIS